MANEVTEVVLPGKVEPSGLQVRRSAVQDPGPGEALIRVEATGISFAEQAMRRGRYYGQPPFPFVPGYDLVGTVAGVGPGVDDSLVGRRVAALTKTGAWATQLVLPAATLVQVPDGIDPAAAETAVVNGVTAWQMLHRQAKVQSGHTILVQGANSGVGTILVQLAQHAGATVIGTASPRHHDALRAQGVEPIDYNDAELPAKVRRLAPGGVNAVFDNVGGRGIGQSFRLLAPGGTLVSYSLAGSLNGTAPLLPMFLTLLTRLAVWNALPNRRHAHFYNVWAGVRNKDAFYSRLRADLGEVFRLLQDGVLTARIAARLPLTQAADGLRLAESRTVLGKVILEP
ncbi:MAG TPA: medium chain dehydrogenase/reductase family protein [Trebonia sp.]